MASEGREGNFDKALARHLRSAAASKEAANLAAGTASQAGACPDSEALAAYHERSLLPEEMNSWKEHIVGCGNCQMILAQLEATDDILLQAAGKNEVLAATESDPVLAARRLESSLGLRAPDEIRSAGATLPAKSRRARLLRGARWQWLVPAGAVAAGLLVWIAWHENQRPLLPNAADIKIAKNEQAPAPRPSAQADQVSPRILASSPKPQSVLNDRVSSRARAESPAPEQRLTADFGPGVAPAKRDAEKGIGKRKDETLNAPAELLHEEKPGDLYAKTGAVGAAQEKAELQNQAANIQTQNQLIAPKVPGPSPLSQVDQAKKAKSPSSSPTLTYREAAPAPPSQPAPAPPRGAAAPPDQTKEAVSGGVAGFNAVASTELVAVSNPHLIPAPGSNVIWRAGRRGLLEFSKDGGASWSRQASGVLVDLLTGSALSDRVCWVVGRVGAILLTTDGGQHWKIVASPIPEDLAGIRASDALHATIWNAKNTKTFTTSDGGLTWQPFANP
ncbi:MAG TPA: hypothetical protein VFN26_20510 [Candidatus Acidoferrum sp.]|nr:hypothetical protein [Candidatus Acidoferrum sp.]